MKHIPLTSVGSRVSDKSTVGGGREGRERGVRGNGIDPCEWVWECEVCRFQSWIQTKEGEGAGETGEGKGAELMCRK